MKQTKASKSNGIKNGFILILVVASLIFRLFINGNPGTIYASNPCACSWYQTHHQKSEVSTKSGKTGQKFSLRFNKRFQLENFTIPYNKFLIEDVGDSYIEQIKIGQPTAYLLCAVIIAKSMRGPPSVA